MVKSTAIIVDKETGETYLLGSFNKPNIKLGRLKGADNDIGLYPVDDDGDIIDKKKYIQSLCGVSRKGHIILSQKGDRWFVTPKPGKHVYIGNDGEDIDSEKILENGMKIFLGVNRYQLLFEDDAKDLTVETEELKLAPIATDK